MHEPGSFLPIRERTDFCRPAFCLFGLAFDHLSMTGVLELTDQAIRHRTRLVLTTPNVNFAVAARNNGEFRDSVIRSDLVVVDGMPLVWLARLMGVKTKRLAGASFFERLVHGDAGVVKVFFFGGPDGIAEKACHTLNRSSGSVRGVGAYYPGFGTVADMTAPSVVAKINELNPDFVVVALGAAKGQAWIERIEHSLRAPLLSHLGAVVNFAAGAVQRAPWIVQVAGLEWLWRIREEPGLWRRYYSDAKSLAGLLMQSTIPLLCGRYISNKLARGSKPTISHACAVDGACEQVATIVMAGTWTDADRIKLGLLLNEITQRPCPIMIKSAGLEWVDQSIVAQFIRLKGHQMRLGQTMIFDAPSERFVSSLKLHCAEYLLH